MRNGSVSWPRDRSRVVEDWWGRPATEVTPSRTPRPTPANRIDTVWSHGRPSTACWTTERSRSAWSELRDPRNLLELAKLVGGYHLRRYCFELGDFHRRRRAVDYYYDCVVVRRVRLEWPVWCWNGWTWQRQPLVRASPRRDDLCLCGTVCDNKQQSHSQAIHTDQESELR